MTMKTISVMIPCYNEIENVEAMADAVRKVLKELLSQYDYELVFIDNASTDGTREKLEEICGSKKKLDFVIEQTLFSLDKYDAEIKARWLAKMFVATFKDKKFSVDEYNAIQLWQTAASE